MYRQSFPTRLLLIFAILLGTLPAPGLRAQEPVTPDVPPDSPPNSLFLPLMRGGGPNDPAPTDSGSTFFRFDADPLLGTLSVDETLPPQARPVTPRSNSRVLLPGSELNRVQFTYEFQTGNRLVIRAAYKNVTGDALFLQPFFFSRNSRTDNIVSSVEPVLSADDLGGDGVLSPDETTRVVFFEVVHKGQPFTYAVDAIAPVELLSAQSGPTSPAVFTGEVYDDSTGLALPGVSVQVIAKARSLSPTVTRTITDERGRYRLVSEERDVWVRFSKDGYTGSERAASAPGESRVELFDARLTPLDGNTTTIPAVSGGTATASDARYSITFQPFALEQDRELRLTPIGGQSIAGLLPKGWSPVSAVQIDPSALAFNPAGVLSVPAPDGLPESGRIVAARWESSLQGWVAVGDATRNGDNTALQLPVSASGQYVFLLADAPPFAPEDPLTGAVLRQAAAPRSLPGDPDVAMSPSDRILLAEQGRNTTVGVTAIAQQAMQSGMAYQVEFVESYDFVDGETIYPEPNIQDFVFYAFPGGPFRLESDFTVTPSRPFDLATLRLGAVNLRLRAPVGFGLPRGELVGLTGNAVTGPGGESLDFPAGATLSTLPVVLTGIDQSGFPLALPPDFTFLKGVQIDFAGGALQRPATLSVAAPGGVTSDDQILLLRLVEVGGGSRLVLAGKAQLIDGRLVSGPAAGDGLPFYGVRREGRYAFVKVAPARSFVYGVVAGTNGQPLPGGLVRVEGRALAAATDPNGQYVIAAPPGPVTVVFADPRTDDRTTRRGQAGPAPLQLNVSLSPTPPSVHSTFPANGAADISLSSAVVVTFTEAIDAASVTAGSVRLLAGGQALPASLSITPNRRVVVLRPSQLLASDTGYTIDITSAIRDLNGRPLTAAVRADFRTLDTTPPPPPPAGSVVASIPVGGFSTVAGSQGTVQSNWVVVIKNLNTGALTTVLPEADGSFSARVAAQKNHKLQLLLTDAGGNRTEVAVGRFTGPDGSVVVGGEGGTVEGEGGTAVSIPPGAFPDGTTVKVGPLSVDNLPAPLPPDFPFVGGVNLQSDGPDAARPLELRVPAPADASPADQVVVALHVTWPGGSGWMVVDRASLQEGRYTTAGSERLEQVARAIGGGSDSWSKGIAASGQYAFVQAQDDCISYVQVETEVFYQLLMVSNALPWVAITGAQVHNPGTARFPARCGIELEIRAVDPRTQQLIQRISRVAPFARNGVSSTPPPEGEAAEALANDKSKPKLIRHNLYNFYQIDSVRLTFSKEMNLDSLRENLALWNLSESQLVTGEWLAFPEQKLYEFTPDVPLPLASRFILVAGPAEDQTPNRNTLDNFSIEFATFAPRQVLRSADTLGLLPSTQAAADIRGTLFVGHGYYAPETFNRQYISVLETRALSVTDIAGSTVYTHPIGDAATGFVRLRAMTALPDIFVTSSGAADYPPEFEPTRAITSILRPLPFITATLGMTETEQIVYWLDRGVVTGTLKSLFREEPGVTLGRRAEVNRTDEDGQVRWFVRSRGDIFLVERDGAILRVFVGRDLLAVLGSTEQQTGKFETLRIYDVTPCTRPEVLGLEIAAGFDCIDDRYAEVSLKVLAMSENVLGLPATFPNSHNVIRQGGVPLQMAVLNAPEDDVARLYIATAGVGLQVIDIAAAPNQPAPLTRPGVNLGPDGLLLANVRDVAVHHGIVLLAELTNQRQARLRFLDTALNPLRRPGNDEEYALTFSTIYGVAAGRFVYDIDDDGNLGAAEDGEEVIVTDADGRPVIDEETGEFERVPDDTRAIDELFDLAVVTGDIQAGGGDALWIVDFNGLTDLRHNRTVTETGGLRIVASLRVPTDARSVFLSPDRHTAYVEMVGEGLSIIDLSRLGDDLKDTSERTVGTDRPETVDRDENGRDDRILGKVDMPMIANRGDVDLHDDPEQPVAFLSNYNAGVELYTVCNNCQELVLDFGTKENWVDQNEDAVEEEKDKPEGQDEEQEQKAEALRAEKRVVTDILDRVVAAVVQTSQEQHGTEALTRTHIYIIEQGSSACMWYDTFDDEPVETCPTFQPGASDHDYELFVPAKYVAFAQSVVDNFANNSPDPKDRQVMIDLDISIYVMPAEPFRAGFVLSSPPMNKSGDAAGDLGLGRQTLLLLWLMTTREYVPVGAFHPDFANQPVYGADAPHLPTLLECLRGNRRYDWQGSDWGTRQFRCTSTPLFGPEYYPPVYYNPDSPGTLIPPIEPSVPVSGFSGIPPLEGYEWAVLQTYNFYHYGAMLRIRGECEFESGATTSSASLFASWDVNGLVDQNHPDRNFDDVGAFFKGCSKRVHLIAKAAIRTVFAQMVAHPLGNRLVLSGRWSDYSGPATVDDDARFLEMTSATNPGVAFCLTGVNGLEKVAEPYTDPMDYREKPCEGFEEYIATMAIESFRRGYNIFPDSDLPLIWQLWCVKVWGGCTYFDENGELVRVKNPITSDEEANEFLRRALDFMERAQQNTRPIYEQSVSQDEVTLDDLTAELEMGGVYPFLPGICNLCKRQTGTAINRESSMGQLRRCNLSTGMKLTVGDPARHQEALAAFDGSPVIVPHPDELHRLEGILGVQYAVMYPLRVRIHNISANELYNVPVALYEGPGRSDGDLTELLKYYEMPYLAAGARTLLDARKIRKPATVYPPLDAACAAIPTNGEVGEIEQTPNYQGNETIFPVLFAISNTLDVAGVGPEGYRALAFVADPEQEFQEAKRDNNQAAFYYYPLDRTGFTAPIPAVESGVPFVLSEFRSDFICLATTRLALNVTVRQPEGATPAARVGARAGDDEPEGSEQIDARYKSDVEVIYSVINYAQERVTDIRIVDDGVTLFVIPHLDPGEEYRAVRTVTMDEVRLVRIDAEVQGRDEEGNGIGPYSDDAYVNVYEILQDFKVQLYDATSLSQRRHPFSRYLTHRDPATHEKIPILGAVTDGAARVQVAVTGLENEGEIEASIVDGQVDDLTDGIGRLEVQDRDGTVLTAGVTVQITDTAAFLADSHRLYYFPPGAFVRPARHEDDAFEDVARQRPRLVRKVTLTVRQEHVGVGSTDIQLRRPPVFLFHGLGGDPTAWNDFRPLVFEGGVSLDPRLPYPGHDGRFRVFAAGTTGTVLPIADEARANYANFQRSLRSGAFRMFAIEKVDVVANSMGGLITREMARQFVEEGQFEPPFGRLITIGTPHRGSPVADKVVAVRFTLNDVVETIPNIDPFALTDEDLLNLSADALEWVLANFCGAVLSGAGVSLGYTGLMASLDIYSGAVDDLTVNSPALVALRRAGTLIPTHYIVGQIDHAGLAANFFNDGHYTPSDILLLWTLTGLFCNWTPDPSTVDQTVALRAGTAATLLPLVVPATKLKAGLLPIMLDTIWELSFGSEQPTPILTEQNDRVVPVNSQSDTHNFQERFVTTVIGDTDHLDIKANNVSVSQSDAVERCNSYMAAAWGSPSQQPRSNLSDKNDVACHVLFLLETDPNWKNEQALDLLYDLPGPADAAARDSASPQAREGSAAPRPPVEAFRAALRTGQRASQVYPLSIVQPTADAIVRAGGQVTVAVQLPPTVTLASLVFALEDSLVQVPTATLTAALTVPVQLAGTQTLLAMGVSTEGDLFQASREILVDPGRLTALSVVVPRTLHRAGQVEQVRLFGRYADGMEREITDPALGTSYTSFNPAVLAVHPSGLIQAVGRGVTALQVVNRHPVTGRALVEVVNIRVETPAPPDNAIPVADPGPAQTVGPEQIVTLDATASSDADDDPLTYRWRQTGGRFVMLINAHTATPTFVAPKVAATDTLTFELVVRDEKGAETLPVEVTVTVNP